MPRKAKVFIISDFVSSKQSNTIKVRKVWESRKTNNERKYNNDEQKNTKLPIIKETKLLNENCEFLAFANDFLRERAEFTSNQTIISYEKSLRHFAFLQISDFNRKDFATFAKNHCKANWSRRTVDTYLKVLFIFGNWLCDNHITETHHRHKFRKKPAQRDMPEAWEIEILFSALKENYRKYENRQRFVNYQRYLQTMILFETGCRISECLNLFLEDIRIKNGEYFILIRGTKSESAERTVLISYELFQDLNDFRNIYELEGRLFSTSRGGVCFPEDYTRWISKFGKSLDLSCPLYAHLFRYLFIVQWIRNGKPLNELTHRLGHSDFAMTLYYAKQVARLCHDIDISDSISILEKQRQTNAAFYNKKAKGW